jgi:hypothetical protein
MANFSFKETINNYMKLKKALNFLKENPVYVGIAEDTTERNNEDEKEKVSVTNADLLFIHTKGSPVNNIPARPVIEPAIEDASEKISKQMGMAAKKAMESNEEMAIKHLSLAGMYGQNASRSWFTNPKNNWPPNSPAVIAAKRRKGSTEPKPLIDTGELRKSITYFVDRKGTRTK